MPSSFIDLFGYLLVASASASFGFLLGTLLQSGKVSKLYRKLEVSRSLAKDQARQIQELTLESAQPAKESLDRVSGKAARRAGTSAFPAELQPSEAVVQKTPGSTV